MELGLLLLQLGRVSFQALDNGGRNAVEQEKLRFVEVYVLVGFSIRALEIVQGHSRKLLLAEDTLTPSSVESFLIAPARAL